MEGYKICIKSSSTNETLTLPMFGTLENVQAKVEQCLKDKKYFIDSIQSLSEEEIKIVTDLTR